MPGMDPCLLDLLDTTIVVSTGGPTSKNLYGVETYSTGGSTFQAQNVPTHQMIRDDAEFTRQVRYSLIVASTVPHSTQHKVTLADGTSPPLLRVERYPDETGQNLEVFHLGHI